MKTFRQFRGGEIHSEQTALDRTEIAFRLEQFANILDRLDVRGQIDTGPVMTTTGVHAVLGSVVAIQDVAPEMILMSEVPLECACLECG
jgi:hypothetical protein